MVALDLARGLALVSTALAVGCTVFLWRSWRPAEAGERGAAMTASLARLLAAAALAGLAASLAALALEHDPSGLTTSAWLAGAAAFAVLAAAAAPLAAGRTPQPSSAAAAVAAVCCAVVVLVPGLSGNAAGQTLAVLVVAANAGHVLAASAWAGGIACLLLVSAWALAHEGDRVELLSATAQRFSAVALVAVVGVALTGVLQGIALIGRVEALVTTGYGRIVMAKAALLCVLALAGALHRGRTLPDLSAAARTGARGDAAARALRRLLSAEALLLVVVFGLTAVLAGGRPPSRSHETVRATAPFGSGAVTLEARPGRPGANELTIELRGAAARRPPVGLAVSARQRRLGLGPIPLRARRSGPARFLVARAALDAPGTWEVTVAAAGGAPGATLRLHLR